MTKSAKYSGNSHTFYWSVIMLSVAETNIGKCPSKIEFSSVLLFWKSIEREKFLKESLQKKSLTFIILGSDPPLFSGKCNENFLKKLIHF